MNDGGIKGLLEDKFEFGGDVGIAAGPVGREASATATPSLSAGILSYSSSRGAFIGAALKGSVISPSNSENAALYGKTAREILQSSAVVPIPGNIRIFPDTLAQFSTRKSSGAISDQTSRPRKVENTTPQ